MNTKILILLTVVPIFIESCANATMTTTTALNTPTYTTDKTKIRQLREQLYISYDNFLMKAQQIMDTKSYQNTNHK